MKCVRAIPFLLVTATVSLAERIAPPTLAPSAFSDTEASTNIVISPLAGGCSFTISLSLDATASNCVEVAVGRDAAPAHSPDGTILVFQ